MPSLKDLRNRISSVKSTQKITKAMQMVAAAKLRRAQMAAEAARPFAERMEKVLANLARGIGVGTQAPKLLAGNGQDRTHLLVVCTAERGLCGAFNGSIVTPGPRARQRGSLREGKTVKMLLVGKKGYEQLRRQFEQPDHRGDRAAQRQAVGFGDADPIGKKIIAMFEAGEFDVCTLFFSRFRSVISQIPTALRLIPAELPDSTDATGTGRRLRIRARRGRDPGFALLPRNISIQVFRALLENAASEQGSRMSAMDNATRNAGEMIKKQTQIYNRSRQAMITKELIEIISGAEAL